MGLSDNDAALNIYMQAHDKTGPAVTSAEGNFTKFSGTISHTTAALTALGAGVGVAAGFLSEAANAAAEDAADTDRLRKAVENSGAAWSDVSGKIDARIKQGQNLAFTDDQTRGSLSLLVAETGNLDEAMKRNQLAMDLSRGMGIDLSTASKLLGKVTDDNIKVLGRYGIHIEKVSVSEKDHKLALEGVTTATLNHDKAALALHDMQVKLHGRTKLTADEQMKLREAQKLVTDTTTKLKDAQDKANKTTEEGANQAALFAAVQQKFGGQAETYGKTTAAAVFRVKDAISEWKESVGAALGGAQPFVALLPGISAGMTLAGGALGPVASGMIDVAKAERTAAIASGILNIAMGPVGLILLGIAAVIALVAFAWANNWGDIRGKTKAAVDFLMPILKGFADFFGGLWNTLGPVVQAALPAIILPIQIIVSAVQGAIALLERLGILHKQTKAAGALPGNGQAAPNVHGIIGAATGFEGWVDKPTWFLTGEGGKPEYVSVTPKGEGGKGGSGSADVSELTGTVKDLIRAITLQGTAPIHLELGGKEIATIVDGRILARFGG